MFLNWVEINKIALAHNISQFKKLIGGDCSLCVCVKSNAYGHGLIECSKIIMKNGADVLSVNALFEAEKLREAGIHTPIYILGYVPLSDLEKAIKLDLQLVVYNKEIIKKLALVAAKLHKKAKIHLKIETGNNRQGVLPKDALSFAKHIKSFASLELIGISTHFANIEDKDSSYAEMQLNIFKKIIKKLEENDIHIPIKHCANSAATIIFPNTHFDMVRVGIGAYGMWPSIEIFERTKEKKINISLKPIMTWKTRVVQIKRVPKGSFIGYGCTYKTVRDTTLAILPIGYYDGYSRHFSNKAHVLIKGKKANILGRVCMNIIMADITDTPGVKLEDEAVLLGKQGQAEITAEELAAFGDTINYEITTRINENIPRVLV